MDERARQLLESGSIARLEEAFLAVVRQAEQSEEARAALCGVLVPMLAIAATLRVPGPTDWSDEAARRATDRAAAELGDAIRRLAESPA